MRFTRLLRHIAAPHWRTRLRFPKTTLDAIEQAVGRAELTHAGEIRFAIETSLAPLHVFNERHPSRPRVGRFQLVCGCGTPNTTTAC